jgi:hypothetical protein
MFWLSNFCSLTANGRIGHRRLLQIIEIAEINNLAFEQTQFHSKQIYIAGLMQRWRQIYRWNLNSANI